MIGNKHTLAVYLGTEIIAMLTLHKDQLQWHYKSAWQTSGYAISPHLPLQGNISTLNVERFLRNLLPEGNRLDELLNNFHLSKQNTFGLVRALGLDVPGALVILPSENSFPEKGYFRPVSSSEIEHRLDTQEKFSLIMWDGKPRLSVAGIQDKINVVLNKQETFGFGEGSLCSTHILKFEKKNLCHLVLNEYITMQLARSCGLNVAKVKLMRYGKYPALLVERFDRKLISMDTVKRRHVIDGCQALNLPPEYKYERNFGSAKDVAHIRDGASLPKLFDLTNQCENPALTKQQIIDWVLFNVLTFNYDAHGKNISFFVNHHGLTLTPFYDLVNVKMYPDFEHELAMALGDEFDGNIINAYQLADFADSCHLSRTLVARRLEFLANKLITALKEIFKQTPCNNEEQNYLKEYQAMIYAQCQHLLTEASEISSITL